MSETVIDERVKMKDIMDQVIRYLLKRIPAYAKWSKKNLVDHLSFYMGHGQLIIHQNQSGKLDGVLALQFIETIEQAEYECNIENGQGVHIRILVADNKPAKSNLIRQAMTLSGIRSWVSFERLKYNDRIRKLPWALAERMASYG